MDLNGLYGAPLERFVAERDELVRTLRKQGEREEAARVAKLRKPSVAAWAVNQLVRTQSPSVEELFEAGDALREAHRAATAGRGDGSTLRAASQRERTALDVLMEAARGLLTSEGHELSPAIIDRVTDTLRAAALDSDARAMVRDGRLERELRHVGLGVTAGVGADVTSPAPAKRREPKRAPAKEKTKGAPAAKEPKGAPAAKEPKGAPAADKEAERAAQQAEAERRKRERAQALRTGREVEAKARRRAERAERAVRVAQERRDRAAEDLEYAEESLAAAVAEAETAVAEHRRVQYQLERL
jgi:hypothetical protein